jgi:hypothetical protein
VFANVGVDASGVNQHTNFEIVSLSFFFSKQHSVVEQAIIKLLIEFHDQTKITSGKPFCKGLEHLPEPKGMGQDKTGLVVEDMVGLRLGFK